MRHWALFRRFLSDNRGAYAVNTAMGFGFLMLAAHVGIDAMRVQNSATGAEQLVDIACQKIGEADPALYPTPQALKAAVEQQMSARSIAGSNAGDGTITVEIGAIDAKYVQPIEINPPNQTRATPVMTNMDLRRVQFSVKYSGSVLGIHRDIAAGGQAAVAVQKPCKPVCKQRGNIVYDNPSALGHWFQGGLMRAGSLQTTPKGPVTTFKPVKFSRGLTNPVPAGTQLVLTIFDTNERIKYRRVIDANEAFYIDDNANRATGEPPKTITRFVVDTEDQLIIQRLNSDGSIPAICDGEPEPECTICGTNNPAPPPPTIISRPRPNNCIQRDFKGKLPEILEPGRSFRIEAYRPGQHKVVFNYPKSGKPGTVVFTYTSPTQKVKYDFPLAPDYIPNTQSVHLNYRNGAVKIPSEQYSMLRHMTSSNLYATFLDIQNRYPDSKYLFHLRAHNLSYWWDDVNDKCFAIVSPIVFDTKGIGTILTTQTGQTSPQRETNPLFDLEGNGRPVHVEWPIGDGQAWLVDNRDGRAAFDMDGKRLFGNLQEHDHGYEKLTEFDTSGTGVLSGVDLEGLALWFDNGNARVDPGEIQSLQELGITSVDTRAEWLTLPNGRMALRAKAIMNGQTIMTEDVFVEMAEPVPGEPVIAVHDDDPHAGEP